MDVWKNRMVKRLERLEILIKVHREKGNTDKVQKFKKEKTEINELLKKKS